MIILKQSITEATENVIIHGCNNRGVFGAGAAKAIAEKWPVVKDDYMRSFGRGWTESFLWFLGSHSRCLVGPGKMVYNLVTQNGFGRDGRKYAKYWAVLKGLSEILYYHRGEDVAITKIGCGLGGLNWETLKPLLIELEDDFEINFYVYEV